MFPKEHALLSGLVVTLAGLLQDISPTSFLLWVLVGTIAGVVIDIDLLLLLLLFEGREEAVRWLKNPLRAALHPEAYLEETQASERSGVARLVLHTILWGPLFFFPGAHPLMIPVLVGIGTHILADAVDTLRFYWP